MSKRIKIELEFYLRGNKRTIPSVNFIEVDGNGIPLTSVACMEDEDAFTAFSKAALEYCKQMVRAGELN